MTSNDQIQTEPHPTCVVCGGSGTTKYRDLTDRLFGAPGSWTIKECDAPACGTLWLDPRPTLADIGKAYGDYYTHGDGQQRTVVKRVVRALARELAASRYGFSASRLPWPGKHLATALAMLYPGLAAHLDLLVRYLPASMFGGGRLLDVGCGDGEALEILRDLGWQVCGVEVDAQAVTAARRRDLEVKQGTLAAAGFPDETFDAVTSSHVIEHVHDPRAFLTESRRVLRGGGTLVAVTPNVRAWTHKSFGSDWRGLEPPRHLALFTAESLRLLAESAGFRQIRVISTARAVALSEIAGRKLRDEGRYQDGLWPGLPLWLRAQARQSLESLYLTAGIRATQGNELVLMATR
ncbi:class I SAM-dependent methyltransferase [uncultured Thiodictyon sp.]|jgi:2-polyprenyl-3-methyl-5-hydroxy-6-metoxy-1,4-benzoquinol methylase|uniref:class I SAM-dependent methyltransferase n=1 Tax=uncultured Thiodictyon sp. TaxID=1846217 RepID=UPI0025E9AA2F|nr:class I SAM-dependent methyltransferase [uncultured Thiodictyon sp.]